MVDIEIIQKALPAPQSNMSPRPLSMPSPPLVSPEREQSPTSDSPRSLSPNSQLSPKRDVRPSSCYTASLQPGKGREILHKMAFYNKFGDNQGVLKETLVKYPPLRAGGGGLLKHSFPSPPSSPSTLSPCSSNSINSSQGPSHSHSPRVFILILISRL